MATQPQQRARFTHPWDSLDFVVVKIFFEIIVSLVLMIVVG